MKKVILWGLLVLGVSQSSVEAVEAPKTEQISVSSFDCQPEISDTLTAEKISDHMILLRKGEVNWGVLDLASNSRFGYMTFEENEFFEGGVCSERGTRTFRFRRGHLYFRPPPVKFCEEAAFNWLQILSAEASFPLRMTLPSPHTVIWEREKFLAYYFQLQEAKKRDPRIRLPFDTDSVCIRRGGISLIENSQISGVSFSVFFTMGPSKISLSELTNSKIKPSDVFAIFQDFVEQSWLLLSQGLQFHCGTVRGCFFDTGAKQAFIHSVAPIESLLDACTINHFSIFLIPFSNLNSDFKSHIIKVGNKLLSNLFFYSVVIQKHSSKPAIAFDLLSSRMYQTFLKVLQIFATKRTEGNSEKPDFLLRSTLNIIQKAKYSFEDPKSEKSIQELITKYDDPNFLLSDSNSSDLNDDSLATEGFANVETSKDKISANHFKFDDAKPKKSNVNWWHIFYLVFASYTVWRIFSLYISLPTLGDV